MHELFLSAAFLLAHSSPVQDDPRPPLSYAVDVTRGDDLFHVTLRPGPLTAADEHLDFVAFAPGVHSVLNFGRFVQWIEAFDAAGEALAVERTGENRWRLAEPTRVDRIEYAIEDSFDTDLDEHRILPCAGTAIDEGYVLLNTFGVLGYFERLLATPVELFVEHDPAWIAGTALERDEDGAFRAPTWRELVDAPLLIGELSTVGIFVGEIEVDIFVRSSVASLDAEEILFMTGEILEAVGAYLGYAPVERYAFLFLFPDLGAGKNRFHSFGALEHPTSSVYTFPPVPQVLDGLARVIAHEFMHVLSPLHLRSTILAEFDYSIPTTDDHLWLYEGVTEWSANVLRLRAGVIELDEYLALTVGKIESARRYGDSFSLARLSREWSTPEGLRQYGNIYELGALTAMCLDLRLLALTQGERGLREVFVDLVESYGRSRPFDNDSFQGEFVAASHPEVAGFFERHVQGSEPLPFVECFEAIGIAFDDGVTSSTGGPRFTVWEDDDCSPEQLALRAAWLTNRAR